MLAGAPPRDLISDLAVTSNIWTHFSILSRKLNFGAYLGWLARPDPAERTFFYHGHLQPSNFKFVTPTDMSWNQDYHALPATSTAQFRECL